MALLILICEYVTILYMICSFTFVMFLVWVILFNYNALLEAMKRVNPKFYGWMQEKPVKWKVIWIIATLFISVFWPMVLIYLISKTK